MSMAQFICDKCSMFAWLFKPGPRYEILDRLQCWSLLARFAHTFSVFLNPLHVATILWHFVVKSRVYWRSCESSHCYDFYLYNRPTSNVKFNRL